jgi:hypothetical protein
MKNSVYIAYFDSLGFEYIENLSEYEKDVFWSKLKGTKPTKTVPGMALLLRAKANPQRFPEIWTFQSEVDKQTLIQYSIDNPQGLADLIREHGTSVYVTPRQKEIIK